MFMDTYDNPGKLQARFFLAALAAAAVVASMFIDMSLFDRTFLYEDDPDWQISGVIRTLLGLIGGIALAFAVTPDSLPHRELNRIVGPTAWVLATIALISYGVHIWTVYALAQMPVALYEAVEELGTIALLQEAALAIALVFLLVAFMTGKGLDGVKILGIPGKLLAAGMAFAVLVLLLEETSYGQHYFGWATPAQFEGNLQQETNLHNFYTIRFEMIYYGAAFVAFVLAPLALHILPKQFQGRLDHFLPPADFIFVAMPLVAGMYLSWNIMPQQLMLFAGVTILALLLVRWRMIWSLPTLGLIVIVVAQMSYLVMGENQASGYEVAEIRENSICFALLGYAVWFWHKNRRPSKRAH